MNDMISLLCEICISGDYNICVDNKTIVMSPINIFQKKNDGLKRTPLAKEH